MESQILNHKSQIKIKVCGLTKLNQIEELVDLKVDFLGFIFYEKSPRFVLNQLSLEEISSIKHQGKVGVFVNESVEHIVEISKQARLNFIQLHGDENESFIIELRKKIDKNIGIIKVIRIGSEILRQAQNDNSGIKNKIEKFSNLKSQISNLLFDTDSKAFGGTGETFDWSILNEVDISIPYFLSGGISLENIHQLSTINQKPIALDINSKFEIETGNKEVEKIRKFKNLISKI